MIQVVTLSPAIDTTYSLRQVKMGEVNRVEEVHRAPGGKGLNVTRVLKKLRKSPHIHCPLGGPNGNWLEEQLESIGIQNTITKIAENTRTAVIISDQAPTVFNEPATTVDQNALDKIISGIESSDVIVFSGSVPKNIAKEDFENFIVSLKQKTPTLIVDTSGQHLLTASKHADYIKPNLEELLEATGLTKDQALKEVSKNGSKVILSLGENGVELHGDSLIRCVAPVQRGNPTGAGDALTAGFAAFFETGEREALRQACALSAASVNSEVAGDYDRDTYENLLTQVEVTS